MSRQIDERIVELQFKNDNFEKGAKQSIETLDKLDKALDKDGGQALLPLTNSVLQLSEKFTLMEHIAEGAIEHIGEMAVDAGAKLLKSFTLDQVSAGFDKYEEKTRAVQTIMNATGDTIDTVNGYLEKLMWFTDETSYNFTDMTSNIGKFTAQGVELDKATTAMQGIALWAAKSGQGANEASRAMYNLSQSLGVGAVKLQDWMSIENANMATAEFKQLAIDTAKELGVLSEAAADANGNIITVTNFRENLSDGWLNSDVLLATLEKYGDYADQLYEIVKDSDFEMTASEAMQILDETYQGIGDSAFKAGQEAKTFSDVMDATADAVSSKWLAMFEIIFGNYEEAKIMWTDLANTLYEVFAEPIDARNQMLKEWKGMGGRDELIEGLAQAGNNLIKVLDMIGEAWELAFPPVEASSLYQWTVAFKELMQSLELTEGAYENLRDALGGFLSIFSTAGKIIMAVVQGITGVAVPLNHLAGGLVGAAGAIGRWVLGITSAIGSEQNLAIITGTVSNAVGILKDAFMGIAGVGYLAFMKVGEALSKLNFSLDGGLTGVQEFFETIKMGVLDAVEDMGPLSEFLDGILTMLGSAGEKLSELFNVIIGGLGQAFRDTSYKDFFESFSGFTDILKSEEVTNILDRMQKSFATFVWQLFEVAGDIQDFGGTIEEYLSKPFMRVSEFIDYFVMRFKELSVMDIVDSALFLGLAALFDKLAAFFKSLAGTLKDLEDLMKPWNDMLKQVTSTLKTLQTSIKADVFKKMATAIAILAASLLILSLVPFEKLAVGTVAIVTMMHALVKSMEALDEVADDADAAKKLVKVAETMAIVAVAVGLMSTALTKISALDWDELARGLTGVTALLGELVGVMFLVSNFKMEVSPKSVSGLILLGVAVGAMIGPLKKLAAINVEELKQGILALGAILGELALFTMLTQKNANMLTIGVGITAMALGIVELVGAIKLLSMFDMNALVQGIGALAVVLLELSVAVGVMGKFGSAMGALNMALLPVLAVALTELVGAIALMGNIPLEVIGVGLLAFAGALGILVAASAGLSVFSSGLLALGSAIAMINGSIAAIIASLGLLALAMPAAAAGIAAFALLSEDTIVKAFNNVGVAFRELLKMLAGMYVEYKLVSLTVFSALVDALVEILPHLLNGLRVICDEMIAFLIEYLPEFMEGVTKVLDIFGQNLEPLIEEVVDILSAIIVGAINGLANNLGDIIGALDNLVDALMDAIGNALAHMGSWLIQKGKECLDWFISGFTGDSKKAGKEAANATEAMGKSAVDGFNRGIDAHSPSRETEKSGANFLSGFLNKIGDGAKKVTNSLKDLGNSAVKGFNDGLFGKSNGAEEFTEKASQDIKKGTPKVTQSATTMGEETSKSFTNSLKGTGTKTTQTIAEEVEESEDIEKAMEEKAKQVSDIFSTEFKKIDLSLSNIGYEFDIWKAIQGPEAEESVIKQGELTQAQKQLQEYAKQYQIAYDNYKYLVENPDLVDSPTELAEKQSEYMKYLAQMYKQAESIAEMQKEMADDYKAGIEVAQEEIIELQNQQAALIPTDFEYSDATKKAYQSYLTAATDAQKQYFYEIWKELADQDYSTAGIPKIDAEGLRKEVLKELGIDPDNAVEGYINVEETVKNLISQTAQSYLTGMEESYSEIIGSYSDSINEGTEAILDEVQGGYPEFEKVGEKMIDYTAKGVEKSSSKVARAGIEVNNDAMEAVSQKTPDWEEVGQGMMDGIRKGIADRRSAVIEEAIEVALAALAAAKQALGIASPSKKFAELGAFSAMGFALGLANTKDNVEAAATNVAESAIDPIFSAGRLVQDMFNDVDPVMTPLIDLSQVEQSVRTLDALWTESTRKIVGDISASEINRNAELNVPKKNEPIQVIYNETFTQNNTSPKALSSVDIYRQTNNLLNRGRRYQAT